jgi:hypothetical protein
LLLALLLSLAYPSSQVHGDPGPPEWVNFYSGSTTYLGEPVPVGAIVTAHDPQGVQCGQFIVHTEGYYGLLPCLRDDPESPEDEGPLPGERVSFRINDVPARAVPISYEGDLVSPSTPIVWTANGDLWEVDLVAPAEPAVGGYSVSASRALPAWSFFALLSAGIAMIVGASAWHARRHRDTYL